jgi:hypothetical protein
MMKLMKRMLMLTVRVLIRKILSLQSKKIADNTCGYGAKDYGDIFYASNTRYNRKDLIQR